ncbi:hypothetical protein OWS73_19275 [Burkholderia sp. 1B3(2022)]|uniref:VapE domain-containing protein n=1 Tax=Burkholderia sp. 1B3(2022) TaxID=2997425 RepID=UPI002FC6659A
MSSTQTNQEQSSSKDSMPNEYVDGNSADEKSFTDQHDPSTTPDVADPVGAIGGAVGEGNINFDKMEHEYDEGMSDFEKASMNFEKNAEKAVEESMARQMKVAADAEERKAAIRAQTTSKPNIFETQSWGFEGEEGQLAELKARQLAAAQEKAQRVANARRVVDIVARAKALEMEIQFKDVKKVRQGDMFIPQAQLTDQNKMVVLREMFDAVPRRERPHRNLFLGRLVDHEGQVIDDNYAVDKWIEAFAAAGLKGVSAKGAREILREWALKREFDCNDLIEGFVAKIPEWDRKEHMAASLIDLFKCDDTKLNREFAEYFWLSLYSRVMYPGSQAPMVMCLIGTQNCGKSYFGKRLARIITGNKDADSVQLNLDGNKLDFLRSITGFSVIASVGEMAGLVRGDLNKIKDFVTRTSDPLHYKFEGHFNQLRQWITIMDANSYDGLQRDFTGNRRFYPVFCAQLPDRDGQRHWSEDFNAGPRIHSDEFEAEVWQIMAECAEWFEREGVEGYNRLVKRVADQVYAFNAVERAANRGTVHDPDVDTFLVEAILGAAKRVLQKRDGSGSKGVAIRQADLILSFKDAACVNNPNQRHIALAMQALGAVEQKTQNRLSYYFDGYGSIDEFKQAIVGKSEYDVIDHEGKTKMTDEF